MNGIIASFVLFALVELLEARECGEREEHDKKLIHSAFAVAWLIAAFAVIVISIKQS